MSKLDEPNSPESVIMDPLVKGTLHANVTEMVFGLSGNGFD
jgi:hypothetical protein